MTKTRVPWWVSVTLIFLLGRIVSTVMLVVLAAQQPENAWTAAHPSLWDFSSVWDGRWYNIIAEAGYPTVLPFTEDGHIAENAWAFLPAYPGVVKLVMMLTGSPWAPAAVSVSVAFAYGATLVFYKLLTKVVPAQQALFAVLLFSLAPVAAVMQVAYAESMQLFLIAVCLYLLMERRYVLMIPFVIALSLTRPGALAIALTLVLHWIYRFAKRSRSRFPMKQRVLVAFVAFLAAIAGVVWIFIAGAMTGHPTAYLETELAWRSAYIGYQELLPFTPWILASQWWMPGVWGYVVLGAAVAGFAVFLFTPAVKRLGVDIRFWLVSYALYVLAVFFPQSSTFRILAPLFPLWGAVAAPKSQVYRVLIAIVCVALQWGWLLIGWRIDGYDWTPP